MLRLLLLGALAAFAPLQTDASASESASFKNTVSAFSEGGGRKASARFITDGKAGGVAITSATAASFLRRGGLMPVYFYPASVVDLAAYGCLPGEVVLNWTAPGNDGRDAGTYARRYVLKISSDPAASPASSGTSFDASSSVATVPLPAAQGSKQSVVIAGLTPTVTYYFAIVALEADLSRAPLSPGATSSTVVTGPEVEDLTATTGFKRGVLAWAAPSAASPSCSAAAYRIYRSTRTDSGFAFVAQTSATLHEDLAVAAGTTYYYRVAVVNATSLEISTSSVRSVWVRTAPALPPPGVAAESVSSNVIVRWMRPEAYEMGLPFADSQDPRFDELSRFEVWRASAPSGPWTFLVDVSTATIQWTDSLAPAEAFYQVVAVNVTERSQSSVIRERGSEAGYVLAPDGRTTLSMPGKAADVLLNDNGYTVLSSTRSYPDGVDGSVVYNAVEFKVLAADGRSAPSLRLPEPATLRLSYDEESGVLVQAGRAAAAAEGPRPEDAAIYWNNGAKWVRIHGRPDTLGRYLVAPTDFGGEFQVRAVARASEFALDAGGVSNRYLTPNGDGLNDEVVFRFDNPRDSQVLGRIYDLQGGLVATLSQKDRYSMEWNGKANGRAVPGGLYVYQLEGDGRRFSGTLVVVR
ncbi:MAG: gliding motility-associated C-terminal domain-containing protein [Elusimicrobia bacterium]|nr:gliding motility-associated C-terminal domain-containing protein [Elusimicrobiota bacterium]